METVERTLKTERSFIGFIAILLSATRVRELQADSHMYLLYSAFTDRVRSTVDFQNNSKSLDLNENTAADTVIYYLCNLLYNSTVIRSYIYKMSLQLQPKAIKLHKMLKPMHI